MLLLLLDEIKCVMMMMMIIASVCARQWASFIGCTYCGVASEIAHCFQAHVCARCMTIIITTIERKVHY